MIRKTNEAKNDNQNMLPIAAFNLPIGVAKSNWFVGLPSTSLTLYKIISEIKIIVLKIDNKKTNINFMELS
ncbi:hypothetical protein MHL_2697 [Mesomycoplasma hyopneumoniae 7422]|nr:hypothetical protein MHL_2697 [Mesomycoplasma hyopneumoniae 7422]